MYELSPHRVQYFLEIYKKIQKEPQAEVAANPWHKEEEHFPT